MFRYYGLLILSFFVVLFSAGYLGYAVIQKIINGKSFKISIKETFSASFGLLIFGLIFIMYVQDLPDVWTHHYSKYEGKCKIEKYSGKHAHVEAIFKNHVVQFGIEDFYNVKAGSYYCKVEYYPHSEEGQSLILYQHEGGKKVETK